jgi:putative endonuclease
MNSLIKSKASQALGKWGENEARKYLISKDYEILHQNWRRKFLEVDLIVKRKNYIIFVEVKTRVSEMGNLDEVISRQKEQSLIQALNVYMSEVEGNMFCQIDLVLIKKLNDSFEIEHLQKAISM